MDENTLDISNTELMECNICYEKPDNYNSLINLVCCNNSKNICIKCIECLTTPICPYCRKPLHHECMKYMNENLSRVTQSAPVYYSETTLSYSWSDFLEDEYIINPYSYDDSRRLRRQIRRLRYEYNQRRNEIRGIRIPNSNPRRNNRRNNRHRNNRHQLNNYTTNLTNLYNQNHENINNYEEEFLFQMD